MFHVHYTSHGSIGSLITTVPCSSLAKPSFEKQSQYRQRLAFLREERSRRGSICTLEKNEWTGLCTVLAGELADKWGREGPKQSDNATPTRPRPLRYTYRYRAGTTVSVLPVGQSTAALKDGLTAAVSSANAGENSLTLWESENRADLEQWEHDEQQEIAHAMQSILGAQRELDRALLGRECRRLMSGTTALEWTSYPRYRGLHLLR
ncbi:hypothetical protein, unknown function [Leishmania tarentolae]|uniref:Uncharacterized protein n=1 Tax=Leishmania tarentolae TaxID=5689 RepID=A0A640KTE7_LEITA|nr:hypothetical protein, unknown function [Leishmania tarentolae]